MARSRLNLRRWFSWRNLLIAVVGFILITWLGKKWPGMKGQLERVADKLPDINNGGQ